MVRPLRQTQGVEAHHVAMLYTINHPRVKLILPPVDLREKALWDAYRLRTLGAWPGEMDEKPQAAIRRLKESLKV